VVVIGSENSSNTVALEQVAVAFGCPRVIRVNDADELPDDLAGTVGVTAGASAPEALVPTGAPDGPEASVDGRDLSAAQVLAALG
jgi:4-hydroxy-3-methylbut-2-enyl diphosphate reductase IspH